MMQCQICGDTQGPFAIFEFKNRVILGCEDCENLTKEKKKYDTAHIRNKRHGSRISRTNNRSK